MGKVIGIDLGTTNCCVAVVVDGEPRVIANKAGYKTTPSIIAITEDGKRVVGQIAVRQSITNPEHTVYATKRLMGRAYDSPQVSHALRTAPFGLVKGNDGGVRIVLREKQFSVPEISAILLQEMRVVAEEFLGEEVDQAVVTVPAYFNDAQRQAVRDAGLIAGLEVLRIINEPTAASLAYGFGRGFNKTIAVYDLGGGTFDISIVRVEEGTFRVISTTGDSFLGGEDFDDRVMEWLIRGFQAQEDEDLRQHAVAVQRLKQAAQKAKCELSTRNSAEVQLPFIVSTGPRAPLHMHYEISREQLEKLTDDLVERTMEICRRGLQMAGMQPGEIDDVVLVGGMTRMPAVQAAVETLFGRTPAKNVHPDEAVALGAAIQGASLVDDIDELSLEDVTAHSLGIATAGDHFEVLLPANTAVPCRVPNIFTTHRDGQDQLRIVVLQGESPRASANELLQDFALTGLRSAPAGEVEVEVAFEIDPDGIFSVSAKDLETGEEARVEVNGQSGFDEQELQEMARDSQDFLEERRTSEAAEELKQAVESLLAELDRLFDEADRWVGANPSAALTLSHARHAFDKANASVESASRAELAEQLVILEDAKSMVQRLLRETDGQRR